MEILLMRYKLGRAVRSRRCIHVNAGGSKTGSRVMT
jgi:hypothetical protein